MTEELDTGAVTNGSRILPFLVRKRWFMVEMQIRANELAVLLAPTVLCLRTDG